MVMATVRFLSKSRTTLTYGCGGGYLRVIAPITQLFSSYAKRGLGSRGQRADQETSSDEPSSTVWPDPNLGLLGPQDRRLPLPGNVGLQNQLLVQAHESQKLQQQRARKELDAECDVLTCQLPQERHVTVLSQVVNPNEVTESREEFEFPATGDILKCVAQDCPQLIRKDFTNLFPGLDIMYGYFTVITLSQKTITEMSTDDFVDIEREELMLYFVIAAEEICAQLKELGYWADFIDPASGRPYLTPYTNSTMFETDERYRHLGFRIEDLGSCKVVTHHAWGPHVFVGCLFTNAPASSEHVKSILKRHRGKKHGRRRK